MTFSSENVFRQYWNLRGEPVKHGIIKPGQNELLRILERGKSRMKSMTILALLPILTVKFPELCLWVKYYGNGLTYTSSLTLHAKLWSRYNYHFASREAEAW